MYAFRTEEILIAAGGRQIFARLAIPLTEEKCPAVICSHGFNGTHAWYNDQCGIYARHGVAACSFDFCGGSPRSLSSGATTDMTIFTQKQDLLAVIAYMAALDAVDENALYLIGGSQGGLVAALAAEECPQVCGMLLYCPAFTIPENWQGRFPQGIPEKHDVWGMPLGRCYFEAIDGFDPYAAVGGYKGPVLIVQGEMDETVPPDSSRRLAGCYPNIQLILLPGENHHFTASAVREATARMLRLIGY